MSKSLGNFVTVRDVLERNDAEGFRWFLLAVHYRGPIQFDTEKLASGRVVFPGVDKAERRVDYVYSTLQRLRELTSTNHTAPAKLPPDLLELRQAVERAAEQGQDGLIDDLNTPVALAALGELARLGNEICDAALRRRKDLSFAGSAAVAGRSVSMALDKLKVQLGVCETPIDEYLQRTRERRTRLRGLSIEQVDSKVRERSEARKSKDFARSDAIRDELNAQGISLQDGPAGTEWSIGP
jgi:cysteinyl-tRNA synthetase